MFVKKQQNSLRSLFCIVLPKLPIFLLALPFVFLMRVLRPIIWIRLIGIPEQIGHALGNTDTYLLERRAGLHPSTAVDIFYPDRPWKFNRQVIKMWKRLIPLYGPVYWIAWANMEIPGFEPHHFIPPHFDRDIYALSDDTPPSVSFNRKEEDRGAVLLRMMGIPSGSRIICFHARDNSFKNAVLPKENWEYQNHRDVDINTYVLAIKELAERGYYCIRMGRVVNQAFAFKHPHVIDYAMSPWRSDFADMYLISRCHFYIGAACGLDNVPAFFRKSVAVVNMIPMGYAWAWSRNHLDIFKKLWRVRERKFLTFKEVLGSDAGRYLHAEQYKKAGLEVIDNTPEEILDAIIEKEERMRGCWQTNDEYEDLQRRFWMLYQPNELNQVFRARIGSKFLLQNRDLL
jgi:putative glycosyltransferase (TIGR04372 family)